MSNLETVAAEGVLVRNWALLALRGAVAILGGLVALFLPGIALPAFVLFFGAFALVDGLVAIVWAVANRREEQHWVALIVGGLLGIAAGLVTFFWPTITTLALVYLFAAWAVAVGITQVVAAIRLRREITGEWLLVLAGLLSIVAGVLVAVWPTVGAVVLTIWIGAHLAVSGILQLALAFKLRGRGRHDVPLTGQPRTA